MFGVWVGFQEGAEICAVSIPARAPRRSKGVILGLEERRPDQHCTRLEEGDLNCREPREEPLGRLPR